MMKMKKISHNKIKEKVVARVDLVMTVEARLLKTENEMIKACF
jgi:hypothetical protein